VGAEPPVLITAIAVRSMGALPSSISFNLLISYVYSLKSASFGS